MKFINYPKVQGRWARDFGFSLDNTSIRFELDTGELIDVVNLEEDDIINDIEFFFTAEFHMRCFLTERNPEYGAEADFLLDILRDYKPLVKVQRDEGLYFYWRECICLLKPEGETDDLDVELSEEDVEQLDNGSLERLEGVVDKYTEYV